MQKFPRFSDEDVFVLDFFGVIVWIFEEIHEGNFRIVPIGVAFRIPKIRIQNDVVHVVRIEEFVERENTAVPNHLERKSIYEGVFE